MGQVDTPVINWLLEEDDPSVRFRALTELLDIPKDDARVVETRAKIPASKAVKRILAAMHPDGYWLWNGKGESIEYSCSSSTHFVLSFLAELGLDRSDEVVAKAVERYLSLPCPSDPGLPPWQYPPDYRNHQSCLYAFNLRTLVMLGYRNDPCVQERIEVLTHDTRRDGGYLCDRTSFKANTKSCIRGSQKALMAYAALPELWQTQRCCELVDYFLRRSVLFQTKDPTQLIRAEVAATRFPFLINASLLEPLFALSKMGYGNCPEMTQAWSMLESKRTPDGRYLLDSDRPKTYFNAGTAGQPNKWVTLYALLANKYRS
jgi:hypothetical protein